MAMTQKERVMATLNFDPVDRMPVSALNGGAWINNSEGISFKQLYEMDDAGASVVVKWSEAMRQEIVFPGTGVWMALASILGADVDMGGVGANMEVKGNLADLEDERLDWSYTQIRDALEQNYYNQVALKQIREVKKLVGEEKAIAGGPCGPFTMAGVLCTIPGFMRMLGKKNPGIPKLLEFTSKMVAIVCDMQAEAGVDILTVADPVASGDMISPRMYDKYVVPSLKNFFDALESKAPVVMHCCGKSGAYTERLIDLGVKGYSVDTMVDMADQLKRCDHKMVMLGSVSTSDKLMFGTREEVYNESRRLLDLAYENGGGFILGSGCDLGATGPIENLIAMAEAAEDAAEAHK